MTKKWLALIPISIALLPLFSQAQTDNQYIDYKELWNKGHYQEALDQLNQEIADRPELAQSRSYRYNVWLSDRSAIYFELGQIDNAVEDLQQIVIRISEPGFWLRLALLYDYWGDKKSYEDALNQATKRSNQTWYFLSHQENVLALANAAERQGENPKALLSTLYQSLHKNYPGYAEGFAGAGDLCLRKNDYQLAQGYYQKALDVDGENLNALAGMAECYWKSGEPLSEEFIQNALAINPNHFRTITLQASILLDGGKTEEALEIIDRALEINPIHLTLRSLKAAAYFLDYRIDEMKALQTEVLEFNPYCSEAYRIPGRVASRHYRFKEASAFQEKALAINPDDHVARASYALDLLRLGKDEEGRKELDAVFAKDPFNVQVFNLLNLMDALEEYAVIAHDPFIIKLPQSEAKTLGPLVVDLLMDAYQMYEEKYQIDLEEPIHIQIFDNHDDFMVRSVGLPGSIGFMGICFGQLVTMDSPTARPKHSMNWRSVLWHEFVHVITLQKTKNRMPRWLSEGVSVYEELALSPAFGHKMDIAYKPHIDMDALPDVEDLDAFFTQPKTPFDIQLGYFLSGEFVRFYAEQYNDDALVKALGMISEGKEATLALSEGALAPLKEINAAFHAYLRIRLKALDNLPEPPAEESGNLFTRLFSGEKDDTPWIHQSSPFTDAISAGADAIKEENWDAAETHFQQAHELFPEFTGANAPLRQLISIYEKTGQREKLLEALQQEVAWDGTDYRSAQKLLAMLADEENWNKTAKIADWSLGIDPFDIDVRQSLLKALIESGQFSQAVSHAEQLAQLDPTHAIEHRMAMIDLLARDGDKAQAKQNTLLLLEEFPHYWDAQELLLRLLEESNAE